jgi:hypothetical protein
MNIMPEENTHVLSIDAWIGIFETPRPSRCQRCRAESVKRIDYGPQAEVDPTPVEERDYVLGGCCFDLDSPRWRCGNCGREWG